MRQAIIERVSKERYGGWSYIGPIEKNNRLDTVETILESAGFFDLLEAAEEYIAATEHLGGCPKNRLKAAIASAKGTQP